MLCSVYSYLWLMIHFRQCSMCCQLERREEGKGSKSKRGLFTKGWRAFLLLWKALRWPFFLNRPDRNSNCSSITPTAVNLATTFWVAVASPEQIGINPNVDLCRLSLILQESKTREVICDLHQSAVIKRTCCNLKQLCRITTSSQIISYPAPYQYYTKPPSCHRLYRSLPTQQSKQDEVHRRQPTLHPCNNRYPPLWDSCSACRHGCFCICSRWSWAGWAGGAGSNSNSHRCIVIIIIIIIILEEKARAAEWIIIFFFQRRIINVFDVIRWWTWTCTCKYLCLGAEATLPKNIYNVVWATS